MPSTRLPTVRRIDVPGFEDVRRCDDPVTGLAAIVAIHDTRLGPALGGTRFWAYPDESAALTDVMRLSSGMTYKAAAAGLPLGGGKAVIIGDPATLKTADLLRAYGRFVESFDGRYVTAADVGTASADLDVIAEVTTSVVGKTPAAGGFGDSGYATALGVFASLRAAVRHRLDRPLAGLRVGVEGAGKVGSQLVSLLHDDGAEVLVAEAHAQTRQRLREAHPYVAVVQDVTAEDLDVYAPCALGATLSPDTVPTLRAVVVCGAANNQLSTDEVEHLLIERDIVWVPDYVANAGGLIQVAAERDGGTLDAALGRIDLLGGSVTEILQRAVAESSTPGEAARRVADERLHAAADRG